jgi:hypothetical protein
VRAKLLLLLIAKCPDNAGDCDGHDNENAGRRSEEKFKKEMVCAEKPHNPAAEKPALFL